jgi:hypothetical protein
VDGLSSVISERVRGFDLSCPEKTPGSDEAALADPLRPRPDSHGPGWLPLAGWLLIGLITTLPGLSTRGLHYDEVRETRMARAPIASQLNPKAFDIDSPPLYHMLLHPILNMLGTSRFSIRLLAWLAGGFLVPIVFVLLRSLLPGRMAILGTLGFSICAWRVELAQMARPHGFFLAMALLSLITFPLAAGKRPWWGAMTYCLVLVAAAQLSYWGILVVIPSHFVATLVCRGTYPNWKRALAAQAIAMASSFYYLPLLLTSYARHSGDAESLPRALAVPLFARCLVLFGAGSFDKLDLVDLPFAAGIALVVGYVAIRGGLVWWRSSQGFSRWLGVCVGIWVVLLFLAHSLAASLPTWPMERRFALLLAPLLVCFVFGVQSMESPRWRYAVMGGWMIVTGTFAVRSMVADPYRDAMRVADVLAAQPKPLLVYSSRTFWIDFLATRAGAASGMTFRPIHRDAKGEYDWMAMEVDREYAGVCVCLVREGGYLSGRLKALKRGGEPPDLDWKLKRAVVQITERLAVSRWQPTLSEYYPGRLSYQIACFGQEPPR